MEEKEKNGGVMTAQEQEQALEQKYRRHDRIAVALVTVLAIVFWLFVRYTQMGVVEQTVAGIRVELRNAGELSGSTIGGYDTTVTIVVKGERATVEALTTESVKAYVDASAVRAEGSYSLPVQIEGIPQGVEIVNQSVTSLIIYIALDSSAAILGA